MRVLEGSAATRPFFGLGRLGDAGGSGATLPVEATLDPIGTGSDAAMPHLSFGAQLKESTWMKVALAGAAGYLVLGGVLFFLKTRQHRSRR